jgi:hypothetical protein
LRPKGRRECLASEGWQPGARDAHGWSESILNSWRHRTRPPATPNRVPAKCGVTALCSDLLSALAPHAHLDVIISSPPSFPGEPRDLADRAWHAGPNYRDVASLFDQARMRLVPGGRVYILLSSDSDLNFFSTLLAGAKFQARVVAERSILFESLIIYELRAR